MFNSLATIFKSDLHTLGKSNAIKMILSLPADSQRIQALQQVLRKIDATFEVEEHSTAKPNRQSPSD